MMGWSRSASVVAAYLVMKHKMKATKVRISNLHFLPPLIPNLLFQIVLNNLEYDANNLVFAGLGADPPEPQHPPQRGLPAAAGRPGEHAAEAGPLVNSEERRCEEAE